MYIRNLSSFYLPIFLFHQNATISKGYVLILCHVVIYSCLSHMLPTCGLRFCEIKFCSVLFSIIMYKYPIILISPFHFTLLVISSMVPPALKEDDLGPNKPPAGILRQLTYYQGQGGLRVAFVITVIRAFPAYQTNYVRHVTIYTVLILGKQRILLRQ